MRDFNYKNYENLIIDKELLNLLTSLHEFRGKQSLYLNQKPEVLNKLIDLAKIQSIESSNRLEGIVSTNKRIKELILEKTIPKNRDEKEIAGYRDVLNTIHQGFNYIKLTPEIILQFHKDLLHHLNSNYSGSFKTEDNVIIRTDSDGRKTLIFEPLNHFQTPEAVDKICKSYNNCIENNILDPLILIPLFIHDFLCIHPFSDGNGRISRLLTTLLLYQAGYEVGKYVSLERLIEENKEEYYNSLALSGIGWKDEEENPLYFVKFLLRIILLAYTELDDRINLIEKNLPAKEMVKQVISEKYGKITKNDVRQALPSLGVSTIEKSLKELVEEEYLVKEGKGKNTFYYKK